MEMNVQEIAAHYMDMGAPGDQQMVIALLKDVQAQTGGTLPGDVIAKLAAVLQVKEALLRALIRRVPSLRLQEAAHLVEVCATCRAGTAIRAFIEDTYHIQSGGICPQKGFAYRVVPCMKNCKNGPSVRFDGTLYPAATVDQVRALIEGIRK